MCAHASRIAPRIGVVTGLASEAAVVTAMLDEDDVRLRVVCAGANTQRAAVLARQLVDAGVEALLSFGIAGALDPALDCGELVLAGQVRGPDGEDYPCAAGWRAALAARLAACRLTYRDGSLLGASRTLRAAGDKQAAHRDSGCVAVDMESAAVAAIAREAGLAFLAVRAVADRATDDLPALVEKAVKSDGRPAIGHAIVALAKNPLEIPATLRLARQSELALAKLRMLAPAKDALFGGF